MVTPDLWRSAVVNSSNALPHSETNTQQKQTTAMLLKQKAEGQQQRQGDQCTFLWQGERIENGLDRHEVPLRNTNNWLNTIVSIQGGVHIPAGREPKLVSC